LKSLEAAKSEVSEFREIQPFSHFTKDYKKPRDLFNSRTGHRFDAYYLLTIYADSRRTFRSAKFLKKRNNCVILQKQAQRIILCACCHIIDQPLPICRFHRAYCP
jgi:hypothetical protein